MASKKDLITIVDFIKSKTDKTQSEISVEAGYKEKYISEAISKDTVNDKLMRSVVRVLLINGDSDADEWARVLESKVEDPKTVDILKMPHHSSYSYIENRRAKKSAHEPFTAPFFPVKAQAGYVKAYDQTVYVDALEQYALPPGVNPQGAIWRYWEVDGESMEPEFHKGDVILTSQVPQMDWENIRNFYLYVLVTEDTVCFKRVFCKNEREWVLISVNEDIYPQKLINVEEIKEVWVFRRQILSKAPTSKIYEIKV